MDGNGRKMSVTAARREFIEMMQDLNFGRIEQVPVSDGEPVLMPRPRIVREIKFGGENGARSEASSGDFALKAQVMELFRCLDQLQDGMIETLVVKHGLPFGMCLVAGP